MNVYTPNVGKIVHETFVDFQGNTTGPVVHLRQYDAHLPVVKVKLFQNGIPYVLADGVDGNIRFSLGNGSKVYNPALGCDESRSSLYFEITPAMTPIDGVKKAVIELIKDFKEIACSNLILVNIERNPVQDKDIDSSGEAQTILRYLADVEEKANITTENARKAEESEINARNSESYAEGYAEAARLSSESASQSATTAENAEAETTSFMNAAQTFAEYSAISSSSSTTYAQLAKSYAVGTDGEVREDDATENAASYFERTKSISESLGSPIISQGTVSFKNLPPLANVKVNWMYNISDDFTTTSDFVEGAGHLMPSGTNVYKVASGKWDCFAGSPVTGLKGDSETVYRKGNVNITKANIGLGNVDNTPDAEKSVYDSENLDSHPASYFATASALGESNDAISVLQSMTANMLQIVSFDVDTGTLTTKSVDYEG